ncbi:MAG: PSD1 and planctomycete cytochrome C domain-containing protein [Mariniblastus sp.]
MLLKFSNRIRQNTAGWIGVLCFFSCLAKVSAQDKSVSNEQIEFYKTKVKPILKENCFECHANDADDLQGSFALTSKASIMRGGDSGTAINSESPSESLLLKVINYEAYEMPPAGKMSQDKIDILTQWVEMGTPFDPSDEKDLTAGLHSSVPQVNAESKKWWSFQPVKPVTPPDVRNAEWPANPIDQFVLSKLESAGLSPAKPASKRTLVRRVYYDLIGLPPTPEQVESFANDTDPAAFSKLVDTLLDSPQYGEKWARHWLDLVRYAESNSFERDGTKPFVWRYRDYVIRSFNNDVPYDRFLTEQLAGDEIEEPTTDSIIATGYYRLGQWDDEPVDAIKAKYDDMDDIIATTSQAMLGLTVNCARCHDHKIDPIPQADYYAMASFFENIKRYGVRSDESVSAASIKTLLGKVNSAEQKKHQKLIESVEEKIEEIVAFARPDFEPVEIEDFQYEMNQRAIMKKRVGKQLTQKQFRKFRELQDKRKRLVENPPGSIKVLCVKEEGAKPIESFIRIRGNPHMKGEKIEPGFISVLSPPKPQINKPSSDQSLGRRLALAKWMVDPANPLTARVMANRIWQFHFGRGIVRTSSDFGFQGSKPTHPKLLDWLATEFVNKNWSIKEMHRLIMSSRSYQMASELNPEGYEKDPANDLLWRFDLRRLTAEEIRDSVLAVNGRLNSKKMFGPSIFPIMPAEVLAGQSRPGKGWGKSSEEDRNRRSIYIHVKRSLGLPILTTNDSADTDNSCSVRFITTQPTQALGMMNSEFTNRQAKHFAEQVRKDFPEDRAKQIEAVLQRVTQRPAKPDEVKRGEELIQSWVDEEKKSHQQAFEYFCLMAINLNEFVYLD